MRSKKNVFGHFAFFLVTMMLLFYSVCIGIRNVFRYNEFKREYGVVVGVLTYELDLHRYYKEQLFLMRFPSYWELQAKKRLGYVNKGDVVYQFVR